MVVVEDWRAVTVWESAIDVRAPVVESVGYGVAKVSEDAFNHQAVNACGFCIVLQ